MFFFLFFTALFLTPSSYSTSDKPTDKIFKELIENADKEQKEIEKDLNQNPLLIKDLPGIKLGEENLPMVTAVLSPYCTHCVDLIKDLIKLDQEKTHNITLAFSVDSKNNPEERLVAVAFWTAYQVGGKESLSRYLEQFIKSLPRYLEQFTKSLPPQQLQAKQKELEKLFGDKDEWTKEELSNLASKNHPLFTSKDLDLILKNHAYPLINKRYLIHVGIHKPFHLSKEALLKQKELEKLFGDKDEWTKEELSDLASKNHPLFTSKDLEFILENHESPLVDKRHLIYLGMQKPFYFSKEDLLKMASQAGLTDDALHTFKESLNSPTMFEDQLKNIHETSQKLKISGFPLIVFQKNNQYKTILGRPRSLEALKKELDKP